ncbi:uncharacterized protein [Primulina eburnea]|uniref:uncharacterized protein n=1 Tax=Primulina eburnea TaxID=1245227 RepID=UPI003C6C63D0
MGSDRGADLKSELYRAEKVEDTSNLRLSYLLDLPCNIQPIYIENDHDLKAYLYLGCPRSRPVLQVEIECVASFDSCDNLHGNAIDENNCNINEQSHFDDYFHLNIVSVDRNNSIDFFDEAHNVDAMPVDRSNTFDEAHNMDVMLVDRSNTDELHDEARDDIIEGDANLVQSNDANLVVDVALDNDTFSFTDGSNLFVGQEFPNQEAVKKELIRISLEACFEFETVKSSKKVYAVKCVVSDCKWRIWTSLIKNDSRAFSVRTYCSTHTCGLTGRGKRIRGASSAVFRDMLVDNFQGHPVPIVPKAVMAMMRNSMNADISYYKAWKGKELADNMLKGDPTQSFTKLSCYLHMVEQMNPGSITDIFVDEENRFKYMFLAFGACLKGKYNGVLLVASAEDGNYHQYPLAWGVVDVECTSSWSWFLTKLVEVVPDEDELVIISDRHQGIINAVSTVYRNAHHGHCTWHLSQNMKTRCKKKGVTELFLHIAKIYKTFEFDIAYNEFRNRYPEAAQYLDERDSLDRWTRTYCSKTRYNIMTTNGVESINARLLEERKLPIIALLDSLQRLASFWFARYRHASIASNTNLTPTIEGILRSRFTDAQGMQVFELGRMEFDVRSRGHSVIVDLE